MRFLPLLVLPFGLSCQDGAGPSVPAAIEIVGGHEQEGVVASVLPQPATARVLDARGRPMAGTAVRWLVVAGYGSATPSTSTTDAAGTVAAQWTLGTLAGEEVLSVRVDGTEIEQRFNARALAGAPTNIHTVAGDRQAGPTGEPLAGPLVVRVVDAYGNSIPDIVVQWTVVLGGGTLSAPSSTTDATGHATIGWTLGELIGEQSVQVTAGEANRTLTAMGASANFNLILESVYLNQGIQNDTAGVGGVARRPGLLRIVVRATDANSLQPQVLVEFHVPGRGLIWDTLVPGPEGGVPTNPRFGTLADTWNLTLAADDLPPDVNIVAIVDPDASVPVLNRDDGRFPRGEGTAPLDVKALHPLRIVFFPIHANGEVGRITQGNLETFLAPVRQWIPTATIEPTIRSPLATSRDVTTGPGWSGLLSDLQAVRVAENATDEYYHGIVPLIQGSTSGTAGIAYVPSSPASEFRSGLSFDRLPRAADVLAHELGHNLGRFHVPSPGCDTPLGIDPGFPYTDGGIRWPAYDILAGQFLHAGFKDYMGYCADVWTSDYTYAGILAWRRDDPLANTAGGPAGAGGGAVMGRTALDRRPEPGLLLWGTIGATGVALNPAFQLSARPVLPERRGAYTIRGTAADGAELFRLAFDGTRVAHAEDPEEAHFAFFVPLDSRAARAVHRIELTGPRGTAVQQARLSDGPTHPGGDMVRIDPTGDGLRLRWAADRNPVALVRDSATGRVLAIGHGGDIRVAGAALRPERLEVLVSDGVTSRRARAQ